MVLRSSAENYELPGHPGPVHVLDLPLLHTKPSPSSLRDVLSYLAIKPVSWNEISDHAPSINVDGIPSYLTRIVASPLSWIASDKDREDIWEAASARLAERSGRSAMPSLTRTFKIPTLSSDGPETIDIILHEPSLTGDNLGHKTWVASYLLAKRLPNLFRHAYHREPCEWFGYVKQPQPSAKLRTLPDHDGPKVAEQKGRTGGSLLASSLIGDSALRVLELGAGTGLVGLAAAGLFPIEAHLTDMESIVENLKHNIEGNSSLAIWSKSYVTAGVLDWSAIHPELTEEDRYDVILAADSLYAPQHAKWLSSTMDAFLTKTSVLGRVMVELPFREGEPREHEQFKQEMNLYFRLEREGEEVGYDDWECNTPGDRTEVKYWWSVWKRVQDSS